ncbi:MAG TPA: cytochrome b/b6 domain-containing protein [Tichowtungia sp.]|nr:cytochrome b/b6 domain-containing protein [Tichowtungia sp.]HKL26154.1 cytochrome b/b6 domain-containing protein [Desulfuromonadales bacterium]
MSETKKIYLQPTPVRIWHWLNAFGIVTLIVTGVQIRFPEHIVIFDSYRSAILLHNTAGLVVAVSFSLWFFYYGFVARNMAKLYIPNKEDLQHGLTRQAKFYLLTYFLGWKNPHHPTPQNKFNPMQKSAYLAIMFVLVPLISLTGIALTNVAFLRDFVVMIGGLKILMSIHFLLACSLCAFLFTHVYLATLGHTFFAYFKPMWTGWEEIPDDQQPHEHSAS